MGDLVAPRFFILRETNPAFGIFLRANFSNCWSARVNFTKATVSGRDANFTEIAWRQDRNFSFTSDLTETSLLLEFDPLGRRRYERGQFTKRFSPYFFAGIGGLSFNPSTNFNEPSNEGLLTEIYIDQARNFDRVNLTVPLGVGLRLDLSRRFTLGIESGLRMPFTDYLDGVSRSGNPEKRDWYVFGGATLAMRFGYFKDKDADGLANRYDDCPDVPGEETLVGCPDSDGDKVADKADKCPLTPGSPELEGCPDKDGDGTADVDDLCPTVVGSIKTNGCPDGDKDGVADIKDECPAVFGSMTAKGCPDMDGDSIPDATDKCPKESGVVLNGGCPDVDTDGDGMVDRLDPCPDKFGQPMLKGCPDSDADGVADPDDECPDKPGLRTAKGCADADRDSVPDYRDRCADVAGISANNGCPDKDTDGDGIVDRLDTCPESRGMVSMRGCPDEDGDGIDDKNDQCPTKAGAGAAMGCPDQDSDGIPDHKDDCPTLAGTAALGGCLDTDGDGVSDAKDKCPGTAGFANNDGCPPVEKKDRETLLVAMRDVQFDVAKATLRQESFGVLDSVLLVLLRYPDYHLRLEGHTDNTGNDKSNLKLSENRARTCKEYFMAKGVLSNRLFSIGYGESKPLAPNTTNSSRQINRRVAFELMLPTFSLKQ